MVIDTATDAVVASIADAPPAAIAIRPDGRFAYVTTDAYTVDVIDTTDNHVSASIKGPFSQRLALTPDGASAYVLGFTSSVAVIDTTMKAVATSIFVGGTPTDVAIAKVPSANAGAPSFREGDGCSITPMPRTRSVRTVVVLLPLVLSWCRWRGLRCLANVVHRTPRRSLR